MAPVNPDYKEVQEREYLGFSHPIQQPKFLSSKAAQIETAGDLLSGAIKGSDEIVKAFARQDVNEGVDRVRNEETQKLNLLDAGINKNAQVASVQTPDAAPAKPDVVEQQPDKPPVPPRLDAELAKAGVYQAARAKGTISETDYDARLADLATNIRSKYPIGYRDYIDDRIHKLTGIEPANAYIRNLRADINSFLKTAGDDRQHVLHLLDTMAHEGQPEAANWAKIVEGGGDLNAARQYIVRANKLKYQKQESENKRAIMGATVGLSADEAEQDFHQHMSQSTQGYFQSWEAQIKANPQFKNLPKDDAGNIDWTQAPPDALVAGQLSVQQAKDQARQAYLNYASKPGKDGRSILSLVKADKVNAAIESNLATFDWTANRLASKDPKEVSIAFLPQRQNDAREALVTRGWLTNKEVGVKLETLKVLHDKGGPEVAQIYATKSGLLVDIAALSAKATEDIITSDPTSPVSLYDQYKKYMDRGVPSPKSANNFYAALQDKVVNVIQNKDIGMEARYQAALSAVDLRNHEYLSLVEGQNAKYNTFAKLGSKDFAKSIADISNVHPEIKQKYFDFLKHSFSRELFMGEAETLNNVVNWKALGVEYHSDSKTGTHRIEYDRNVVDQDRQRNVKQFGGVASGSLVEAAQVIERLNSGLRTLGNAATAFPGIDPDAYLLKALEDSGVDLNNLKVTGLPSAIAKTLINSRTKQQKTEDSFKNTGDK